MRTPPPRPEVELVERRDRQPERQRAPEVVAVEADRLGDQLPDRALAGRQRRRQLRHRAPRAAAGTASRSSASAVVEAPERAVGLGDLVDDRAHLERGHAGELAGAQHGEALHRLDLAAGRAADAGRGADRADARLGKRGARGREQRVVGQRASTGRATTRSRRSRSPRCRARAPARRSRDGPRDRRAARRAGGCSASARAVAAAASTGPTPHTSERCAARSRPSSSRSVAAITSTART